MLRQDRENSRDTRPLGAAAKNREIHVLRHEAVAQRHVRGELLECKTQQLRRLDVVELDVMARGASREKIEMQGFPAQAVEDLHRLAQGRRDPADPQVEDPAGDHDVEAPLPSDLVDVERHKLRLRVLAPRQGGESGVHIDAAVSAGVTLVAEEGVEVAFAAPEVEQGLAVQGADDSSKGLVPPKLPLGRPTHRLGGVAVVAQVAVEEGQEFLLPIGVHATSITLSDRVVNPGRHGAARLVLPLPAGVGFALPRKQADAGGCNDVAP